MKQQRGAVQMSLLAAAGKAGTRKVPVEMSVLIE